jgi:hypothetical protein
MESNPSTGARAETFEPGFNGNELVAGKPSKGKTMATAKSYQINGFSLEQVRNRNETRVVEWLRQELPKLDGFCGCRICVEDAYAAAMNSLTPQYAQVGSIILRKTPAEDKIRDTVVKAIERVHLHPKHNMEPPPLSP